MLVGVPAELLTEFKGKLHPYLIERVAGKISVDVENASLDDVCAAARPEITAHVMRCEREALDRLRRASAPAGAARRASPRCSTHSTRRGWRRC